MLASSCKEEIVPKPYRPRSEYDAYRHQLESANLLGTNMGQDWQNAGWQAMVAPVKIDPPYMEAFYLASTGTEAVGYRFSAKRGQKIEININRENINLKDSTKLFIDLFRINNDSLNNWSHVASADENELLLGFEPRRDADYIVRVQAELLRGGKFTFIVKKVAVFDFPVLGKNSKAIGSYFGDPRDGGKRDHHGVDIFAKRHTPVLAPIRAYVRFVGERGLGGNVVWLRDQKGRSLYFAHLQTQVAKKFTWVNPGDTIGTVGNSGNARTTPTHLHFGIYQSGPVDPIHFIRKNNKEADPVLADKDALGTWVRTKELTWLMAEPMRRSKHIDTLEVNQLAKVQAAHGEFYRIITPDGITGFVKDVAIEKAIDPIEQLLLEKPDLLLENPSTNTYEVARLTPGLEYTIHGKHKNYLLIKTSFGQMGWLLTL
ncbi:MAG: peptidoglycan DD-metalloendopeptidase family protein [Bacteroidetes bacterium]|nr:peptidoglycan DD-metalloendopeptidase family protein [Bacteroidota bacterium]